jgi:hypothetical protein
MGGVVVDPLDIIPVEIPIPIAVYLRDGIEGVILRFPLPVIVLVPV